MPTKKQRINLTVDQDLNELLDDIAELTDTPKARFIKDILVDMQPMLIDLRDALKNVESKQSALPQMAKLVLQANTLSTNLNSDLINQLDLLENLK